MLPMDMINWQEGARLPESWPLGGGGEVRNFLPDVESWPHLLTVGQGGKEMSSRAAIWRDGTLRCQEPLGLSCGLTPRHPPLSLTWRLMRVFRPIVEIAMLPMFHPGEALPLRGPIALQLISDNHPWDILAAFEELAEDRLKEQPRGALTRVLLRRGPPTWTVPAHP